MWGCYLKYHTYKLRLPFKNKNDLKTYVFAPNAVQWLGYGHDF